MNTTTETITRTTIMKIPANPVQPGASFHQDLMDAKTKAQVIDVLCKRGSSQGWFSDMPEGLWQKLQILRNSPQRQSAKLASSSLLPEPWKKGSNCHYRLATTYRKLEDDAKTREHLLYALETAPHYREAQQLLLEILR